MVVQKTTNVELVSPIQHLRFENIEISYWKAGKWSAQLVNSI
jgi:hypothetical protein